MNEEIIEIKTPYGYRYELRDKYGNCHPIYNSVGLSPYIKIDGMRLGLLPSTKRMLKSAIGEKVVWL